MENTNQKEVVLSVKNVRQYFSNGFGKNAVVVKAVHNVSFDVYRGEVFGLVGESGCGKTTTGRSIIKLYQITDGDIYFNGKRISGGLRSHKLKIKKLKQDITDETKRTYAVISEMKGDNKLAVDDLKLQEETNKKIKEWEDNLDKFIEEKAKEIEAEKAEIKQIKKDNKADKNTITKIQMIFQDPIDSLNPRMTVREIIAEGLIINGERNKDVITKKVNEALNLVGLVNEHASRYPHEFSGGQRQRIGIARALVTNPEVIIADEPISALDVSIQAQVINLLNDLRDKFNLTILFIAHNLSVVKYFCDRIGVMYYGRLVEVATAEELFAHPLHPYTKSLLSAVPIPDPDYEKNHKRLFYNPRLRKYTSDKPQMVEIRPGHFVYGSKDEIERYDKELQGLEVEPDPTLISLS